MRERERETVEKEAMFRMISYVNWVWEKYLKRPEPLSVGNMFFFLLFLGIFVRGVRFFHFKEANFTLTWFALPSVLSTPYEDDRIDFTIADIPLVNNLGYISTASYPKHCKVIGEALKGAVVGQVMMDDEWQVSIQMSYGTHNGWDMLILCFLFSFRREDGNVQSGSVQPSTGEDNCRWRAFYCGHHNSSRFHSTNRCKWSSRWKLFIQLSTLHWRCS